MTQQHDPGFEESLLSGYLDGELTQADEQRVRLRLEDDPEAHKTMIEMRRIREAARTTQLAVPVDEEWNEAPRSAGSRWLRKSGWILVCGWAVVVAGLVVWGLIVGPEEWWEKLLAVAVVGGPVLLFVSILLDRLKVMKHDRYGRVER
jgi:anti-sigma factor RsiW